MTMDLTTIAVLGIGLSIWMGMLAGLIIGASNGRRLVLFVALMVSSFITAAIAINTLNAPPKASKAAVLYV